MVTRGSGVSARHGAGWQGWRGRSSCGSGSESHADAHDGVATVERSVSCLLRLYGRASLQCAPLVPARPSESRIQREERPYQRSPECQAWLALVIRPGFGRLAAIYGRAVHQDERRRQRFRADRQSRWPALFVGRPGGQAVPPAAGHWRRRVAAPGARAGRVRRMGMGFFQQRRQPRRHVRQRRPLFCAFRPAVNRRRPHRPIRHGRRLDHGRAGPGHGDGGPDIPSRSAIEPAPPFGRADPHRPLHQYGRAPRSAVRPGCRSMCGRQAGKPDPEPSLFRARRRERQFRRAARARQDPCSDLRTRR